MRILVTRVLMFLFRLKSISKSKLLSLQTRSQPLLLPRNRIKLKYMVKSCLSAEKAHALYEPLRPLNGHFFVAAYILPYF